ncbi:hypothetical protein Ciccas_012770, partial [Cichlidogyrus casuarinus]
ALFCTHRKCPTFEETADSATELNSLNESLSNTDEKLQQLFSCIPTPPQEENRWLPEFSQETTCPKSPTDEKTEFNKEFRCYTAESQSPMRMNPLDIWRVNATVYPRLSCVAKAKLTAPAGEG